MRQINFLLAFIPLTIFAISCSDCKENFAKEYNNNFGQYFGFEKKLVFENNDPTKLYLYGSKEITNAQDIKIVFFSQSSQLHFAEPFIPDIKLYIKYGNKSDTVNRVVYSMEKKAQFEETISYLIPIAEIQNILSQQKSASIEITLSNYKFILSDEIACCLKQLIKIKK